MRDLIAKMVEFKTNNKSVPKQPKEGIDVLHNMIRRVERENIRDREVKRVTEEKLERIERRMNAAQAEENTEDVRKEDLQEELRILKEKHQDMEKEYNTLKKEKKETDKKLCTKWKNNGSTVIAFYAIESVSKMSNLKIVIIGAGAAGVAAAATLLENGFTDVVVLEAKGYIGGRIKSVKFGDAFVDLGAEFCHGEKDNIVYEMVKDLNVLEPDPSNPQFFYPNQIIDPELKDSLVETYEKIYYGEERQTEESLGEYFTKRFLETVTCGEQMKTDVLEVFRKQIMRHEGSFSWFDVAGTADYVFCEGLQSWNWKGQGYKTVFDILLKKVQDPKTLFHFNKDVVGINWGEAAIVFCADGTQYQADHVLVTMSVGVLKATHFSLFNPSLPASKIESINRLPMQAVAKIFFHFTSKWWSNGGYQFVWRKVIPRHRPAQEPLINGKSWVRNILGLFPVPQNPNVLKMWFVGGMVPELETCSEEAIINGLMYVLELFFSDRYPNITRPDKVIRHNWYSDKHFRGTYSFQSLQTRKGNHSDAVELSTPLLSNTSAKPIVLFAGEATHPKYYSTVHGAIETGFREANRLITLYK
ncbi:hypothetical protein RN001_010746 [Aquatica leii]|uniref:Amine oxidase domain-containing protein n=1 Tax=Aquatica leii TaxID=1421715 RepID=A0AAN7Q3I6_9COLE|nr:hypothetical protein RN001_010746 [Aquatica leii]